MVVSAAATVDGLGVQQRAYLAHGVGKLAELLAAHGDRAASGTVQAEYQPHRGRLARPVRAEEPGDPAGLDREGQLVHGQLGAVPFGDPPCLDHCFIARGLTKRYCDKLAVDQLTFTVEPGRITGFLGPNGAGKTTAM